jgi:glycosyltransferase involved in cell wall biosynthesis
MYARIQQTFASLPRWDFEAIFVDNASTDTSYSLLKKLAVKDKRVKIIFMSRNTGSPQPSFIAGMSYANGVGTVLLHGDIQDPPEVIPRFVAKFEKGYDVVYGIRTFRKGVGVIWNFYYKAFYFILNKLSYVQIPIDAGEFSLMSRRVVESLLSLPEFDYNVRCLRAFVGFRQTGVRYIRQERRRGTNTATFISGLRSAEAMIIDFSFTPMRWMMYIGFMILVLSLLFTVYDFYRYFSGLPIMTMVPAGTIILMYIAGLQFMFLSVIGMYLSKIFLDVKGRPRFIIGETVNIGKNNSPVQRVHASFYRNDYELLRPLTQGK